MTELGDKLALRDRCEEEGRQARATGVPQYENPYWRLEQHEERGSWADGWWEKAPAFIPLTKQSKSDRLNRKYLGNPLNSKKVA